MAYIILSGTQNNGKLSFEVEPIHLLITKSILITVEGGNGLYSQFENIVEVYDGTKFEQ